eukprot:Gb_35510 [translate_table: standard]
METQVSELGPSSLAIKDSSVPDKIQMGSEETSRNEVGSTLDEKLPNLSSIETETGPSRVGLALMEYPTVEELVSKARAPVRSISTTPLNGKDELSSKVDVPKVYVEKKSKTQLKRERERDRSGIGGVSQGGEMNPVHTSGGFGIGEVQHDMRKAQEYDERAILPSLHESYLGSHHQSSL